MTKMDANRNIVATLQSIADVYRSQGQIHKFHAYRNAIETIRHEFTGKGIAIVSAEQLKGMKAIGKAMYEKIDEMLRTGALRQQAVVSSDPTNVALKLFTSVHGVGPVAARKLVDAGYRTLDDLRTDTMNLLPPAARVALQYHEESEIRIPYDEIEDHLEFIRAVLRTQVDARLIANVCGSHRRRADTSGDIDVLLTHPASHSTSDSPYEYLAAVVSGLKRPQPDAAATSLASSRSAVPSPTAPSSPYILASLAEGSSKYMGYCRLPYPPPSSSSSASVTEPGGGEGLPQRAITRRLDIRWVTADFYPCALLYFTGSDTFNVNMRLHALKMGYKLNEYRIAKLSRDGSPPSGVTPAGIASVSPDRGTVSRPSASPARMASPEGGGVGGYVVGATAAGGDEQSLEVTSERDVFRILGLPWTDPWDR